MGSTPARLHHNAYVVKDQRVTREFYEDLLGLPLIATWTESEGSQDYCHTFFGLEDGSALAFFQFADPLEQERWVPRGGDNPYVHIALVVDGDVQESIRGRLDAAKVPNLTIDHGYCVSLYVTDPDGLIVELTRDHPDVEQINAERRAAAHADLERWLAGDRTTNNVYR
ncbi:MAG: VOC family protein [Acidimicrobiales bacterium]